MKIEQYINNILNRFPKIKKVIKRIYQRIMYIFSKKKKVIGNVIRITPNDEYEYFFGYYDKSPWNMDENYMICLRAKNTWENVAPAESAEIILIDTNKDIVDESRIQVLGTTHAWNVQQGCMLQWLGPDFSKKIIYNDFRDNKFCSIILDIETKEEKVLDIPVYSVASNGLFALSLDFSRLHTLGPGYGYSNLNDLTKDQLIPDGACIRKIDFNTGKVSDILSYKEIIEFDYRKEMDNANHKVNHIMLSPDNKRFMVLHRWFKDGRKYTRLVTCDITGKNLYNLSDDDMVSHCYWKNNDEILAFEHKNKTGNGYYLMKDKTQQYKHLWKEVIDDGHPSYSPNGKYVITDSYPNRSRMQTLKIMIDDNNYKKIAEVFSPFRYDNDTRCDLHPRWDRKSEKICFDSTFEGKRGLYYIDIRNYVNKHSILKEKECKNVIKGMVSCVIPTYKRSDTLCRAIESVLNQTYKNIEVIVVDDNIPNNEYSKEVQKKMKKYSNNIKVRLIQQHEHRNGAVARNIGIKEAKGEFIAFLDDDDEWLPEKIEKQMEYLYDNSLDIVSCLYTICKNGLEISKCHQYDSDNIQFKVFSRDISIYTSNIIIKKETVLKYGGFDESLLRHQDLQFLIDGLEFGKFGVLGLYLTKIHADSDINKPDALKLIEYKKYFFESVNEIFNKYSKVEKRMIKNAHKYEVAYAALKSKKIILAIKYIIKAGFDIKSIKALMIRFRNR